MKAEERVVRLSDFARDHKEWTVSQAARILNWSKQQVYMTVRDLRDLYGEDEKINLVCESTGHRQEWLYRLTDQFEEARWWLGNRAADCERRIRTQYAVARSLVAATDGRTPEGRRVRLIVRYLGRLFEDMADLESGFAETRS